ncbi:propionyl-coenzyme A carboxylase, alpha polypeptide, putative, partial [Ixodes scapularis]
ALLFPPNFTAAASTNSGSKIPRGSIEKILIANRGEIACRVIRSAKKLGIRSVAVYSDADRKSMHVTMADEAYHIGPAASQESYLRYDRILATAKRCGAQAIHPGYGFLSENTEFAELCAQEGIIFVGPPASAIRDMGIKSTSKAIMSAAGVPVIVGYHGEEQSEEKLKEEARRIGFPVMAKAVRGGGGKGMRIVMNEGEFDAQLESAKREAMKSFGDDNMLIEKFVANPRQVQVFGDHHGNYVYLFERDCSVQRRHQKVIEEAPAPGVTEETRRLLGEAAVKAARAVNYVGAGTVEFIMDVDQKFYFMEMNTRLQVEHPITEMITGTDLVEWQIKVPLPFSILLVQLIVPALALQLIFYIVCLIENLTPTIRKFISCYTINLTLSRRLSVPSLDAGDEVSVHYDPMIAKLAVWGPDRASALRRLHQSLSDYTLVGLANNISFLMRLASHPSFKLGDVHTEFIPLHHDELFVQRDIKGDFLCAAVLSLIGHERAEFLRSHEPGGMVVFHFLGRVHVHLFPMFLFHVVIEYELLVTYLDYGSYRVKCGDEVLDVHGRTTVKDGVATVECDVGGSSVKLRTVLHDGTLHVFDRDGLEQLSIAKPAYLSAADEDSGPLGAVAPMPGVIEKLFVKEGDAVKEGDPVVVMIAMKMEYVIKAPSTGVIEKLLYKIGDNVPKNAQLVKIKSDEAESSSGNAE